MEILRETKKLAKGLGVLYVEHNEVVREKVATLLEKIFERVDSVSNAKEGLEKLKHTKYDIVITDIKIPDMNGFEFTLKITKQYSKAKIIIISSLDDKKYLLKALELGVSRYLLKPIELSGLIEALSSVVNSIKKETIQNLFSKRLKSIFNYQASMIVLTHDSKLILANKIFLDFFDVASMEVFKNKYLSLSTQFLEHKGFLYQNDAMACIQKIEASPNKLFHVKMKNKRNEVRHFILKYKEIPSTDIYGTVSFTDITELNLLDVFDSEKTQSDVKEHSLKEILELLTLIQGDTAKLELHNFYKGLSITNDATIENITNEELLLKTSYQQQKAIQFEKKTFIISDALPFVLEASELEKIVFGSQEVSFKGLKFVKESPVSRKTIRVIPCDNQEVSLFLNEKKLLCEISIEDISLDGLRLKLTTLPAGLDLEKEVHLELILELDKKPLQLNLDAKVLKKRETSSAFYVVLLFEKGKKSALVKYITKRQMATIREFKGLSNE